MEPQGALVRAAKPRDEYEEVVRDMLALFRHASSIARGRGAHNKVPMKERVRWARIAIDAGSHLLERDILDKYKRKKGEMSKDELIKALSDGKIKVDVNLSDRPYDSPEELR